MQLQIQTRIKDALRSAIRSLFNVEIDDVVLNLTPKIELGELASPVCFELARKVKKAPRSVAEELIRSMGDVPGVRKIELAGAGFRIHNPNAVRSCGCGTSFEAGSADAPAEHAQH